jgi:hypothetical protein
VTDATTGAQATGTTQAIEETTAAATQATTEATTAATTTATTTATTEAAKVVPPTWREDWRQALSKGDDKALNRLSRFASPEAIWDAYRNMEVKVSAGKFKPELSDNPTPDELGAYRKAYGIPDAPDGYLTSLPEGLVIGEDDKEAALQLAADLHAENASPKVFAKVMDRFYNMIEESQTQAVEANKAHKLEAIDALRQEYGAEFRGNINTLNNWMAGLPDGVGEYLENSVGPDGMLLMNNKEFVRSLIGQIKEWNPASTVVPAGSGSQAQAIGDEIAGYEKQMRENISAWQHASNAATRTRYVQLLEAKEKLGSR